MRYYTGEGKYDIDLISKYYITKQVRGQNQNVTNLKLQKLLYYSKVLYYKTYGMNLYKNKMYVSNHGIVIEDEYHKYRKYNFTEVYLEGTSYHTEFVYLKRVEDKAKAEIGNRVEKDDLLFLEEIWDKFKNLNGKQLEKLIYLDSPIKGYIEEGKLGTEVKVSEVVCWYEKVVKKEGKEDETRLWNFKEIEMGSNTVDMSKL